MNDFAEEIHELEQVRTSNKRLRVILDDKYKRTDLTKAVGNPFQHLIEKQRN